MSQTDNKETVPCHRISRERTAEEHRGCPYCFGDDNDIATGEHAQFCDYDPKSDPICFGFPTKSDGHPLRD